MSDFYPEKPKRGKRKNDEPIQAERSTMSVLMIGLLVFMLISGVVFALIQSEESDILPPNVATPSEPQALPPYDRGMYYMTQGQFAAAAQAFTMALDSDPERTEVLSERANAYFLLGDFSYAIADYKQLTGLSPNDAMAWYGLAQAEYELFIRTDSAQALERAILAIDQATTFNRSNADIQALEQAIVTQIASLNDSE